MHAYPITMFVMSQFDYDEALYSIEACSFWLTRVDLGDSFR
jgi:hypothetical protein